jgi:hypothetical protein
MKGGRDESKETGRCEIKLVKKSFAEGEAAAESAKRKQFERENELNKVTVIMMMTVIMSIVMTIELVAVV